MTSLHVPPPADVRVTHHAVEQLLIRFPEDLFPKDPEAYLHQLLRRGHPYHNGHATWRRAYGGKATLTLRVDRWNLILEPNRHPAPPWVLVTVKRVNGIETSVPRALREDRLTNHQMFRTGQAAGLLHQLIQNTGTRDLRTLSRLWYEARYPLVLHGGYETFEAFYRAALVSRTPAPPGPGCAPLARTTRYDPAMPPEVTTP